MNGSTARDALKDVKVLDFTWSAAGPITTRYLAAHGATGIRVESASRPDALRTSGPFKDGKAGVDKSGNFSILNANKYSISLNLNNPEAKKLVKRLITWADVLTEGFTPGVMEKWGLGYEEVREIKRDIIYLRTSNLGQTGRDATQPGFGQHLVGFAGLSYYSGWPDRDPLGFGMAYTDVITPRFAVTAIMAALDYRRRTGEGQSLDIAQLQTAVHFLSTQVLDYTANGRIGNRQGNRCSYSCPYGVFPCKGEDTWCAIAVFTDDQWNTLKRLIDRPWTEDARFQTVLDRKQNENDLEELLSAWTVNFEAPQLMELLQNVGVPCGVAQNAQDIVNDPQLKLRESFWTIEHEEMGPITHLGRPFTLSRTPAAPKMSAPCLGQHNEYVCTQILGMSDEEFIELFAAGAFD